MTLKKLLYGISYMVIRGELDIEISNITYDSENVQTGDLFIGVKGTKFDGHNYINEAVKKGATVIIIDHPILYELDDDITIIMVADTRRALANISANYFDNPARYCTMIGITGTKGKTTTSNMIKSILEYNHKRVGLIGTNGAKVGESVLEIDNTTPLSYQIHKLLRFMVEQGCEYVIMEVSSQGLKMARVEGIEFDYAIFTNISFDHVGENEHKSIEEYKYWKSRLFMQTKVGIVNSDIAELKHIIKDSTCNLYSYSIKMEEKLLQDLEIIEDINNYRKSSIIQYIKDKIVNEKSVEDEKSIKKENIVKMNDESEIMYKGDKNSQSLNTENTFIEVNKEDIDKNNIYVTDIKLIKSTSYLGSECIIHDNIIGMVYPIKIMVAGVFNIYNALAAITCCSLIFTAESEKVKSPKKLVELTENNDLQNNNLPNTDFAKTEFYIKNLEEALKNFYVKGRVELVYGCDKFHIMIDYAHNEMSMAELLKTLRAYKPKRLVCLFGCGGNRSKLRRYSMGEIGGKYADFCIITEDNSRLEPPKQIIKDILIGMVKTVGEYVIIYDRKEAIRYAIENAKEGDLIVLIGKGHEAYQDKNGIKTHFSEHEIVAEIVANQ